MDRGLFKRQTLKTAVRWLMGLSFIFQSLLLAGNIASYPKLYKLPIWSFLGAETLNDGSVSASVFFINALILFSGILILANEASGIIMGIVSITIQIFVVHLPILFGPISNADDRVKMGGSESSLQNFNEVLYGILGIFVLIRLYQKLPTHICVGDKQNL